MVASAKNRKNVSSVNIYLPANPQNIRNSDGRRQLFGLSQAIREKAFQSTSPRSEGNTPPVGYHPKQDTTPAEKSNSIPTIEDRLRSLFNSDTEEVNNIKKLKSRSKTPDADVMIRNSSVNKTRENYSFNEGDTHRMNGKSNKLEPAPQRRCASAVPTSFNDRDWNRVPLGPHHLSLDDERRMNHPTKNTSQAWNHPPTASQRNITRSSSAIPYQNGQRLVESGTYINNRPVPTARRSLYVEKDLTQPNARTGAISRTTNPSQHPASSFQTRTNGYVQENPYARAAPVANAQTGPHQRVEIQKSRPVNQKLIYLPRNPTVNGNARVNLRQVDHHTVATAVIDENMTRNVAHANEINVKAGYNPSVNRVSSVLAAKPHPRDYYPHQNFSFRRAVRRSLSSDSEKNKSDTKWEQRIRPDSPLGVDKTSRKSDDRDSGTVVEPEASVFDFDSSVLSEEEIKENNPTHPVVQKETSRTSTPILPPLSSEDEFTDVVEPDECPVSAGRSQTYTIHKQVRTSKELKQENKALPPRHLVNGLHVSTNGVAELSTTESAIHDGPARKFEQKTKLVAAKPYRVTSSSRRGFHRRPSSGDEKRQKKSRHRRIHDDSDVTDCSSRRPSYRIPDRKSYPYDPSYKNSYCSCLSVANDKSELGDTSSVLSMTTASVCSSLLRKTGSKRHHHHRKYHAGSDKYSREIRSITKRFSRLEAHVVTLARSLAQLSSELRQQNATSREVELLRQQMQELRARVMLSGESPKSHKASKLATSIKGAVHPKKNKHEKMVGEQPPLLTLFLKELGYEKYIKNFETESIGMMELPYLDEKRMQDLGIPLGPRIRIMKEAQKSSYV